MRVGVEAAAAQHHVAHGIQQRDQGLPRALPRLRIAAGQDRRKRRACAAMLGVSRFRAGAAVPGRLMARGLARMRRGTACDVYTAGETLRSNVRASTGSGTRMLLREKQ